MASHEVLHT